MEKQIPEILGQVLPRLVERSRSISSQRLELRRVVSLHALGCHFPRADRSLRNGLLRIDHQLGIEEILSSDPLAGGAGPKMAVEGKMFGRQTRHCEAGRGVTEIGREFLLDPLA